MSPAHELDPEIVDAVAETLDHFNADHPDTVLLIARFAAGARDAVEAEATDVDATGVGFAVRLGSADAAFTELRATFTEPVTTLDALYGAVYGLLGTARAAAGDTVPPTSLEHEFSATQTLPTFVTEVRSVATLTPNLRRIVIGGPSLATFESKGGDQFFYTIVARPGADPLPDGYTMGEFMADDSEARPYGAYYTVRGWDPERHEIELWAVVHGHDEGVGGWFGHCAPGDRLAIWGPREGVWSDGRYAPAPEPRHHLFVTDESGFAAVAVLLERLAEGDAATVIAETGGAECAIEFPGQRTNVRWWFRGDEPPGTGEGLLELVRETVAHGPVATAFGAGESRQMTQIRKHLRHTVGLPARAVTCTGYWRRDA